jgi:hypothetical protein
MVSDRELLIQALETYVTKTVGSLFGFTSLPAQALMRYGVRTMADKYGFLLDMFTSSDGSIIVPLMIDAAKSEIKSRGGLKIWNVKITESDFEEILNTYCELQRNNG